MNNRLFRSESNRVLAGVCGGLGAYFGVDPTWVRLIFILLALPGVGIGFLLYLVLWVILPLESQPATTGRTEIGQQVRAMGEDVRAAFQNAHPQRGLIAGAAMVLLGFWFLLDQMHLTHLFWLRPGIFWPVVLIAAGAVILLRRTSSNSY